VRIHPISEINLRARNALVREVSAVDTIRFLDQFRTAGGNYTEEREHLFQDMMVREIILRMPNFALQTQATTKKKILLILYY